jgi:hypothetical protein
MVLSFVIFGRMEKGELLHIWGEYLEIFISNHRFPPRIVSERLTLFRVAVPKFPNLFLLTGPNTLPSGHSSHLGIEASVTYILRLLEPLVRNTSSRAQTNISGIEVKEEAENSFNEIIQGDHSTTVEGSRVYLRGQLVVYR